MPELRKVTGYRGELLTDQSRESFKLLGFKSGVTSLMGLKSIVGAFSAVKAGFMPGSIQGSALQLGGAVIIQPDGTVSYRYASTEAGDHPAIADMLATLP